MNDSGARTQAGAEVEPAEAFVVPFFFFVEEDMLPDPAAKMMQFDEKSEGVLKMGIHGRVGFFYYHDVTDVPTSMTSSRPHFSGFLPRKTCLPQVERKLSTRTEERNF